MTLFDYIPITMLNDFLYCPYSIYLRNIYHDTDDDIYKATPQVRGTYAHKDIDNGTFTDAEPCITAINVASHEYGIMGTIDILYTESHHLVERKYQLNKVYQGHTFQMWGQYVCLLEMGYTISKLSIHSQSDNVFHSIPLPTQTDLETFRDFINRIRKTDITNCHTDNPAKCQGCIYSPLCPYCI